MSELSLREKVDWLASNEGCELADGWQAFQTFISYCVNDEDDIIENKILELCKEDIEYQYDTVKGEQELEDEDEASDEEAYETSEDSAFGSPNSV